MKLFPSATALAIALSISIPVGSTISAMAAAAGTDDVIPADETTEAVKLQSENSQSPQVTPSRNSNRVAPPTAKDDEESVSRDAEFPSYCTSDSSIKTKANLFFYQEALYLCKFGS